MQVEITDDGFWVDANGKRWRLVPVNAEAKQMDAAKMKAERWGLKGKQAKAAAWDYVMGYCELVEQAPSPTSTMLRADPSKMEVLHVPGV